MLLRSLMNEMWMPRILIPLARYMRLMLVSPGSVPERRVQLFELTSAPLTVLWAVVLVVGAWFMLVTKMTIGEI
jgi:hypothetical protein